MIAKSEAVGEELDICTTLSDDETPFVAIFHASRHSVYRYSYTLNTLKSSI